MNASPQVDQENQTTSSLSIPSAFTRNVVPTISEWPFELLDLVFCQVSVKELLALIGTCRRLRDTTLSVLLARHDARLSTLVNRLYSPPSDDDLSINIPEQHASILLYALHIAPPPFFHSFKTLSISCVFPCPDWLGNLGDTIRDMQRLTDIFRRTRQFGQVSLDLTQVGRWIWEKRWDKGFGYELWMMLRDLLIGIVNKGCRSLKVELKPGSFKYPGVDEELGTGPGSGEGWRARYAKLAERLHMPQALRTKPSVVRFDETIQPLSSNLTSVVASAGMLTDPFFRTTLFNIIHTSKQLTSLALQFPEFGVSDVVDQGTVLAQLKIPSLRSYTVQSTAHVDLLGHEYFLKRHPLITSLYFPHSYRYFAPPSKTKHAPHEARGWTLVLPSLERLTCDSEVLPYFLKNMDTALPRLQEVMIVWFSGLNQAEMRLNQSLKCLENELSRIPIIGLRTAFNTTQFEAEGVPDLGQSFIRNRVVKLDLHFLGGVPVLGAHTFSRLHKWMRFPNVQSLMFSSISRHARTAAGDYVVKKPAERRFGRWSLEEIILVCIATSYFERIPVVWFEDEVYEIDLVRKDQERLCR